MKSKSKIQSIAQLGRIDLAAREDACFPLLRTMRTRLLCGSLALCALFNVSETRAVTIAAVQVYDENVNATNFIESQAPGNAMNSTAFTSLVSAAFTAGNGGVINFDTPGDTNATVYNENINATFGSGKQLSITSSVAYNFRHFSSILGISGNGTANGNKGLAPADTVINTTGMRLNFGPLTGAAPGEAVTTVGFTVLTRSTVGQSVTVNWFINGASTPFFVQTDTISMGTGTDDTFFSYAAPTGSYISGFQILYGSATGSNDVRMGIDDLGFTTSVVPEPSRALLASVAFLGLMLRRRR